MGVRCCCSSLAGCPAEQPSLLPLPDGPEWLPLLRRRPAERPDDAAVTARRSGLPPSDGAPGCRSGAKQPVCRGRGKKAGSLRLDGLWSLRCCCCWLTGYPVEQPGADAAARRSGEAALPCRCPAEHTTAATARRSDLPPTDGAVSCPQPGAGIADCCFPQAGRGVADAAPGGVGAATQHSGAALCREDKFQPLPSLLPPPWRPSLSSFIPPVSAARRWRSMSSSTWLRPSSAETV